jgi:hypothetical protein
MGFNQVVTCRVCGIPFISTKDGLCDKCSEKRENDPLRKPLEDLIEYAQKEDVVDPEKLKELANKFLPHLKESLIQDGEQLAVGHMVGDLLSEINQVNPDTVATSKLQKLQNKANSLAEFIRELDDYSGKKELEGDIQIAADMVMKLLYGRDHPDT